MSERQVGESGVMMGNMSEPGEVVCKLGGLVGETGKTGGTGEVMGEVDEEVKMAGDSGELVDDSETETV